MYVHWSLIVVSLMMIYNVETSRAADGFKTYFSLIVSCLSRSVRHEKSETYLKQEGVLNTKLNKCKL